MYPFFMAELETREPFGWMVQKTEQIVQDNGICIILPSICLIWMIQIKTSKTF